MSSQIMKFPIQELFKIPECQLQKLSLNKTLQTCTEALGNKNIDPDKVLAVGIKGIKLKIAELTNFELEAMEEFLSHLIKFLSRELSQQLEYYLPEVISNLIKEYQEILSCTKDEFKNLHFDVSCVLTYYGIMILEECLRFCDKCTKKVQPNNGKSVLAELRPIQRAIISILTEDTNRFSCETTSEINSLLRVIACMTSIGEFVSILDIPTTAEIWKCLIKLCVDNCQIIKGNNQANNDYLSWLRKPVKFLCREIIRSVTIIYQGGNKQPINIAERNLKINAFYMKLLIKFASSYEHEYFRGSDDILEIGIILLSPPLNYNNKPILDLMNQYLTVGFMSLLQLIYKNGEFVERIVNFQMNSPMRAEAFQKISLEVFKEITMENENSTTALYINSNFNILQKILTNVPECHVVFASREMYENAIKYISAFILSCECNFDENSVLQLLVNSVLQNDLLLAQISIDIWCILARFMSADSRFSIFKFWLNVTDRLPQISSQPREIFAKSLTRQLYNFLTPPYKLKIWENPNNLKTDSKILLTLGVDSIPDEKLQNQIRINIQRDLSLELQTFLATPTKQTYYKIVNYFQLSYVTNTNNSYDLLVDLLDRLESNISDIQKFHLLISAILKFINRNATAFSADKTSTLFEKILKLLLEFPGDKLDFDLVIPISKLYTENTNMLSQYSQGVTNLQQKSSSTLKCFLKHQKLLVVQRYQFQIGQHRDSIEPNAIKVYLTNNGTKRFNHICQNSGNYQNYDTAIDQFDEDMIDASPETPENQQLSNILKDLELIHSQYFENVPPNSLELQQINKIIDVLNRMKGHR